MNEIKVVAIGFPSPRVQDSGISTFYGPHDSTALFVTGIGPLTKQDTDAMGRALSLVMQKKEVSILADLTNKKEIQHEQ